MYTETAADQEIDFEILKQPQFWAYSASANAWTHSSDGELHTQNSLQNSLDHQGNDSDNTNYLNSSHSSRATQRIVQRQRRARTIQCKVKSQMAAQRQLLSAKQMNKVAAKAEMCYLAMIFPT